MLNHLELLDHVAQPVFVLVPDAGGRPVYAFWNRACEQAGGQKRDQVLGRTAVEIFRNATGGFAYDRQLEALSSRKPQTYEVTVDFGTGPMEVRTTLSPVMDGERVVAVVGSSVILRAMREAERRTVETLAVIDSARSEMEQYLAFAAHDLRAPMRQMLGLAEILQDELPDGAAAAKETAVMMESVSRKAQDLIADVLRFSEAVNAEARVEVFDLRELALDIFTVLDPMGAHDLQAETVWLSADRTALQIILRNLVDNAVKHTDKDRVRLCIETEVTATGVDLLVQDDGPGLPSGDLSFLEGKGFEYGQGFGLLGLRRLLSLRDGTLTARNRPEGGTEFRVTLPGTTVVPEPASALLSAG